MVQFPETRHTLIRRLAEEGQEADWNQFLNDYWRAICRFACRWGKISIEDAEDVASLTFLAILESQLLQRWISAPQSKLRTLVCQVVRNILSNRARVQSGREALLRADREFLITMGTIHPSEESAAVADSRERQFYMAWVDELLQLTLRKLQKDYLKSGRGDYFRVLYGRVCEEMGNQEIADNLRLKITDVENYYKRSKLHLREQLRETLAVQIRRYCPVEEVDEEIQKEWDQLGEFLKEFGGLDLAIRKSYEFSEALPQLEKSSRTTILKRAILESSN